MIERPAGIVPNEGKRKTLLKKATRTRRKFGAVFRRKTQTSFYLIQAVVFRESRCTYAGVYTIIILYLGLLTSDMENQVLII